MRTSAWGFGLRGWVREKKVWRDGERLGRFEEKSSPSGGCERQSASFLLQRQIWEQRQSAGSISLYSTRNDRDPRTQPSTTGRHAPTPPPMVAFVITLPSSFVFFSISLFILISFIFFVLGMAETFFFFFFFVIRFGCRKLMNVCKFGLLSKWL